MSDSVLNTMYPGRVGPWGDDARIESLNANNWGAALMSQAGPKYLEWVRRGYIFTARPAAAAPLVIFSTATNAPTLWNPASSNKLLVPIRINLHPVAVASAVHTGVLLGFKTGCGDAAGAGQPFTSFVNKVPTSNLPSSGKVASGKFADNVVGFTAIPAIFQDLGLLQAAAGLPTGEASYDFDGTVALGPGDSMSVMGQAASVNAYWMSVIFAELPLAGVSLT